ncbi:amino acid adenylation domain-containing protein [Sinorhizobium medicae]|nr:amino acid adenylation domain-containing protein [Sinorhizobium medicae]
MPVEPIVLSPQQERLWQLSRAVDGEPYLTTVRLAIVGASVDAVRAALREVFESHPVLRLRLRRHPALEGPSAYEIDAHDATNTAIIDPGGAADIPSATTVVSLRIPAYCADTASAGLIAASLAVRLGGIASSEPPVPFALVADWAREMAEADETAVARAMWRERIAELRLAIASWEVQSVMTGEFAPRRMIRRLAPEIAAFLRTLDGHAVDGERSAGLLAALSVVCQRRLGVPLPIGVRLDGRGEPDLRSVVGPLARVLPVGLPELLHRPLPALVGEACKALFEASAWQDSFSWGAGAADEAGRPLFAPVAFALADLPAPEVAGSVTVRVLEATSIDERFVYRFIVEGEDLVLDYDAAEVDEAGAGRMLDGLNAFLQAARADPTIACGDLPVLGAAEQKTCIARLRVMPADPAETPLDAFRRQARAAPHRIAVECAETGATSYGALDAWSEALAGALSAHGAAPEQFVAICLPPSAALAATFLAAMKAGAAFAPLEPEHPPIRRAELIGRLAPVALVAEGPLEPELAEVCHAGRVAVLAPKPGSRVAPAPVRVPPCHQQQLAYALFTSGSTGAPRCVGVPLAALANQIAWFVPRFGLGAGDRVIARTSPVFDAALWEILAPLAAGATIALAPAAARLDVDALAEAVRLARPTRVQFVPNLLESLLTRKPEALSGLDTVFVGGEVLDARQAQAVALLGSRSVNLYGPTECCIQITAWDGDPARRVGAVPVGSAIPGVGVAVAEDRGAIAPIGAIGNVIAGGICLARGYLGDPVATACGFVPDGLSRASGARLHPTGDIGAMDETGALVVLGRADAQVKIRGARVEPAEVAAVLRGVAGVADCAVLGEPTSAGGLCLVAVFVADNGCEADVEARLPQEAARRLPDFMRPARFVPALELPRLASGKLDVVCLRRLAGRRPFEPPATATERLIADTWREVLELERVGRHDGFFGLGGHSILMLRVLARLRIALGREVPLRMLYDARDLAELALWLDAGATVEERGPVDE